MATMIGRHWVLLFGALMLLLAWFAAYLLWPKFSFDDGPFFAESFAADVAGLSVLSSVELRLFGVALFVLETRATRDVEPRTVFVLKNSTGSVRWAKVTAAEFGRIQLIDRPPRWFVPGGWIVVIKPERTESGELYLSAFGKFRFFFHSW